MGGEVNIEYSYLFKNVIECKGLEAEEINLFIIHGVIIYHDPTKLGKLGAREI